VYELLLRRWGEISFGPAVEGEGAGRPARSPKRMRREARDQKHGVGTKAQQAIQLQREQQKEARLQRRRRRDRAEEARMFRLRQEKRREKHKGR